jgi:DNA-binding MarR family transcriptional regulator
MGIMNEPLPLSEDEELLWRALLRVVVALPKALDEDLVRATGVSLTEYTVLMNLSEAADQELRLADLAAAVGLSVSRISRLVEDLRARDYVSKRRCAADGRGAIATLTPQGLRRLQSAYPEHLASARRRVVNHFAANDRPAARDLLVGIAAQLTSALGSAVVVDTS